MISVAATELGVPDICHRRTVLVQMEGRTYHFATVLRVGFLEPSPARDRVIRPDSLLLTEQRQPASQILNPAGLLAALGGWRAHTTDSDEPEIPSTLTVNKLRSNDRLVNPWCVEPAWVIDCHHRNFHSRNGPPVARFYDPAARFFARSIGDAAWKWLRDPGMRGANTIPNSYRILIQDARAWIAKRQLERRPNDNANGTLVLHVRTGLAQLPGADIIVETNDPDQTEVRKLDRTRIEVVVPLAARMLSVHLMSTIRHEWLDEYLENEFNIATPRLLTPGQEPAVQPSDGFTELTNRNAPKAFVAYSRDNDVHRRWVEGFAATLRSYGIDAILDQWSLAYGDQLPKFMEQAVSNADYVLIICTPNYKIRSDTRTGGVGYEGDIMSAEVFNGASPRKFIPVLRDGSKADAIPTWLAGKKFVDLRGDDIDGHVMDLVEAIHGKRDVAPPLGDVASAG